MNIIAYKFTELLYELHEIKEAEKNADLFAVDRSREALEGAIYLFTTLKETQLLMRQEDLLMKWLISPNGDNRIHSITHPSESERIFYFTSLLRV